MCRNAGEKIWRHNAIRDLIFETRCSGNLALRKEPPFTEPGSERRLGETVLPLWSRKSSAIDVTVVCPHQTSALSGASKECGFTDAQ